VNVNQLLLLLLNCVLATWAVYMTSFVVFEVSESYICNRGHKLPACRMSTGTPVYVLNVFVCGRMGRDNMQS
jgi:hypothetical protein